MIEKIPDFLKEPKKRKDFSVNEEVKAIFEFLGRSHNEGEVKGDHLASIITYLIMEQHGDYKQTLSKLALKCGIGKRYITENYLDGLEAFGIIEVMHGSQSKFWRWKGL